MTRIILSADNAIEVKEDYDYIRGRLSNTFDWVELTRVVKATKDRKVMINKSHIIMFE